MSQVQFRVGMSGEQTKALIDMLVASLADYPGTLSTRCIIDVVLFDDDTRKGQRNGHGIRISAEGQSHLPSLFATAHDVVVSE